MTVSRISSGRTPSRSKSSTLRSSAACDVGGVLDTSNDLLGNTLAGLALYQLSVGKRLQKQSIHVF
jgi:hypothetical protein